MKERENDRERVSEREREREKMYARPERRISNVSIIKRWAHNRSV